jgi:hypothetical protein
VKIVDARSGHVVRPGQMVKNGPRADDWYTILRVNFRSLLTRTAHVIRHDGRRERVVCPVKLFPQLTFDSDLPAYLAAIIYPS